mmetsp:Transcript_122513/g.243789  ORF Transcript_122513/g.243789 Transcript_122513/m.243789 type:complete len:151 (+) Transcript_122513:86-538(+)
MMRTSSVVCIVATLAVKLVAAEGWSWWWLFGSSTDDNVGNPNNHEPQELAASKSNQNVNVTLSDSSDYNAHQGKVFDIKLGSELQTSSVLEHRSELQTSLMQESSRLQPFGHSVSDNDHADLPRAALKPTESRQSSAKEHLLHEVNHHQG